MTNGPFRKRADRKARHFHAFKQRTESVCGHSESKEYFFDASNLDVKSKNDAAENLYKNPHAASNYCDNNNNSNRRLEAGDDKNEIFYDCFANEGEADKDSGILQQQLHIIELINDIKNPKEFKGALKQMAHAANVLYRTFGQAYSQDKRRRQKVMRTNYEYKNPCWKSNDEYHATDKNPQQIISAKVMPNKQEYYREQQCLGQEKATPLICENTTREQICPICLGTLDNESAAHEEKYYQKVLETDKVECFVQAECLKADISTCLVEEKFRQQYEDELHHLNFCDRCALLRGQLPSLKALKKISQETAETPNTRIFLDANLKTSSSAAHSGPPNRNVVHAEPINITIPLKLQLEVKKCPSHSLENEIVVDAYSCQSKTSIKKSQMGKQLQISTTAIKSKRIQQESGSDMFHSCISNSGIIKPERSHTVSNEIVLNEILELIRQHFLKSKPKPLLQSKSVQTSSTKSLEKIKSFVPQKLSSKTVFIQTAAASPAAAAPTQLDPSLRANKLRAQLLKEITAALTQSTTLEALKMMSKGKRFSLPTTFESKEPLNGRQMRQSAPSTCKTIPLRPTKSTTVATQDDSKNGDLEKPLLPAKPKVPPKPEQKDGSTLKYSGHFKRNEMRDQIQKHLTELLQQSSSKPQEKYRPEERDEILLDLHKLFHPGKLQESSLPEQISRESVLQDIRYLVQPETNKIASDARQAPKASESQDNVLESIRYILSPKSVPASEKIKYSKDEKEKVLENLQLLLTPRTQRAAEGREIRDSVLQDIRFMLNTRTQRTVTHHTTRSQEFPQPAASRMSPASSTKQQHRQQQQQQQQETSTNDIRDSVMADLRYLLDSTHQASKVELAIPSDRNTNKATTRQKNDNKNFSYGSSKDSFK